MIFNIAVVEDEEAESDALVSLLERYRKEYQMSFSYKCFENAFLFLQEFKQRILLSGLFKIKRTVKRIRIVFIEASLCNDS